MVAEAPAPSAKNGIVNVVMTMVAACRFDDGGVFLADSRATWATASPLYRDALQKLLYLDPRIAIGFCGDVYAAAFVVNEIRRRVAANARLRILRRLVGEVPRFARHGYRLYSGRFVRAGDVELILVAVTSSGIVEIHHFRSPHFNPERIQSRFIVRGSGDVVREYLTAHIDEIASRPSLQEKAHALVTGLEAELQRHEVASVGGLFQTLILDATGIRPLRYGFVSLDPDRPSVAKSIELRKGTWTQQDHASGTAVVLSEPASFIGVPATSLRAHDLKLPTGPDALPKWHLTYFVTCLSYNKTVGSVEFGGTASMWATEYPTSIRVLVALAAWGSAGDYDIELRLVSSHRTVSVDVRKIHFESLMLEVAGAVEVSLPVEEAGPAYLECWVDNRERLARRALYFGRLVPPQEGETEAGWAERQEHALRDHGFEDPEIAESDSVCLTYFTLCRHIESVPNVERFDDMPAAVYSKSYPVSIRFVAAIAFRGRRGAHALRIELVHAETRAVTEILRGDVESSSSSIVTPVHAYLSFAIPSPGIYFVNLTINGTRVTTSLLVAETAEAQWSYRLRSQDIAKVEAGELIALGRGSLSEEEAQTRGLG